ncbi:MAG: chemotaxis protein CheX [Planctomycetes bacterium]|nr:chemotaxis protein CheX [Planctomycetota bacterium]
MSAPLDKSYVGVINPFIRATVNAMKTMVYMEPRRTNLHIKKDNIMKGDISAIMGLTGTASGTAVLSFSERLAIKIFSNMICMKANSEPQAQGITLEVEDSMREMINLVGGGAKNEFTNSEFHFMVGIPSIISGSGHRISRDPKVPCIACDFEAEGEPFFLEISLSVGK